MTTNETAALKTAADNLADLAIEGDEAGLMLSSEWVTNAWAMIGTALVTARRPEKAPLPIPSMTATLEGQHVQLSAVLRQHNARKREAGL